MENAQGNALGEKNQGSLIKRIYDNVYGYISVERNEYQKIIKNPFFQRLHNIRQMGLTNLVFPGAEHTRFAHSLGVMHIVEKMMAAQEPYEVKFNDDDKTLIRLSALLHDIGHFPLSHTIEQVLLEDKARIDKERNKSAKIFNDSEGDAEKEEQSINTLPTDEIAPGTKLHEKMGEHVLENTGLVGILKKEFGVDARELAGIFKGDLADRGDTSNKMYLLAINFMHSQLDADRIDYLMRDSSFTGVKSGAIDFDKLLHEIYYQMDDGKYGIDRSGIRVLEQFFMARFAAYCQVPFNKKVQGFNHMAAEVYRYMLNSGNAYGYYKLVDMLKETPEEFLKYNDHYFYSLVYKILDAPTTGIGEFVIPRGDVVRKYAQCILKGQALKLVISEERFCTKEEWIYFIENESQIERLKLSKKEYAIELGMAEDDIIIIESEKKPLKVINGDKNNEPLYIYDRFRPEGERVVNILDLPDTFLSSFIGTDGKELEKKLYIRRVFTFEKSKRDQLKDRLYR
ncbi:MAG: HD domain-containing protein [Clostridia bacterium]|nr:HD domain-containing protein [Clostridia bacterium]